MIEEVATQIDFEPENMPLEKEGDEDMDSGGEWQSVSREKKRGAMEDKKSMVKKKGKKGVTKSLPSSWRQRTWRRKKFQAWMWQARLGR